jgi:release factor glutamine methyltransferase
MRLITLPGVFRPRSDSRLLAQVVSDHGLGAGVRALDMFTGSGILALTLARNGARAVTAVDVLRRAVLTVRLNARLHGVDLRACQGDLFDPVAGERFDLITANPPYLPGDAQLGGHGASRAWEGGADGRALIDRFCASVGDHLAPGGTVALVHSSLADPGLTLAALAERGVDVAVLERRIGPLGPIASARRDTLVRRGVLANGQDIEEMLVIIGRQSPAPPMP